VSKYSFSFGLIVACAALLIPGAARAQQRDVDYDWMMATIDGLIGDLAPSFSYPLAGRDRDTDGVYEEDTLGMFSTVLRGGTRVAAVPSANVTQIQADFATNRTAVDDDMAVTGMLCSTIQTFDLLHIDGEGIPDCKLTTILHTDELDMGEAADVLSSILLDFFAGLATSGNASASSNTFTFINDGFLNQVIEALKIMLGENEDFADMVGILDQLKSESHIYLSANNYYRWGETPRGTGRRNAFGPNGVLDNSGATNITYYNASHPAGNRETWMTGCGVSTPPIHIITQPIGSYNNHINNGTFTTSTKGASSDPYWSMGSGWTIDDPKLRARHSTGSTAPLSQPQANQRIAIVSGTYYRVKLSVQDRNAGSVTVALGTAVSGALTGGSTVHLTAAGTSPALVITPTSDFDGYIDDVEVTIPKLTGDPYTMTVQIAVAGGTSPFYYWWEDASDFTEGPAPEYGIVPLNDTGFPGVSTTQNLSGTTARIFNLTFHYPLTASDNWKPWCRVWDSYTPYHYFGAPGSFLEPQGFGGRTSAMATIQVTEQAFEIRQHPVGAVLLVGGSHTMTAGARGGNEVPTYTWHKDGSPTPIPGQATTSLPFTNAQVTDTGSYTFRATNSAKAQVTSNPASLIVVTSYFTAQPAGAHKKAGPSESHTFSVTPNPALPGPFTYQWYKGALGAAPGTGTVVGTNQTLTVGPALSYLDQGTYSCRITFGGGVYTATSNGADLTVLDIQTHPSSLSRNTGQSASFSVTVRADSGTPPYNYTYLWYYQGSPAPGTNNLSSYTVSSCQAGSPSGNPSPLNPNGDAGDYYCVVGDGQVTLQSLTATLSVNYTPLYVDVDPIGESLYVGDTKVFHCLAAGGVGGGSYTYQWFKDDDPLTGEDDPDLDLGILDTDDAGDYQCFVGEAGVGTPPGVTYIPSEKVTLDVADAITFSTPPDGANKKAGDNHAFNAVATGGYTPYQYDWYKDSVWQATAQYYPVLNLSYAAHQGAWTCRVTDRNGTGRTVESSPVDLTVLQLSGPAVPTPSTVSVGAPVTVSVPIVSGSGLPGYTYLWYYQGIPASGTNNQPTYQIAAAQAGSPTGSPAPQNATGRAGSYTCRVTDSAGVAITSGAGTLTVTANPITFTQQPSGTHQRYTGGSITFSVRPTGGNGPAYTYAWRRNGTAILTTENPTADEQDLVLTSLVAGQQGDYDCVIGEVGVPSTSVASTSAELEIRAPLNITGPPAGGNKAAGGSHTFTITVTGGFEELTYEWYRNGTPVRSGTGIAYAQYQISPLQSPTHQATYWCKVTDQLGVAPNGQVESAHVDLTVLGIQTQPITQEVAVNDPANISLVVRAGSGVPGVPPNEYTYLWYYEGSPAPGVNNQATYSIAAAQIGSPDGDPAPVNPTGNAGEYYCHVTDVAGAQLDSNHVVLMVTANPIVFLDGPEDVSNYVGQQQTFAVVVDPASGQPGYDFIYQWCKDGTAPENYIDTVANPTAATSTLVLTSLDMDDEGLYRCLVGQETVRPIAMGAPSSAGTLTIGDPLSVTDEPDGAHKAVGDTHAGLSVSVAGGHAPLTYAWYRADIGDDPETEGIVVLQGEGDSYKSYNPSPLEADDQGTYCCIVTDSVYEGGSPIPPGSPVNRVRSQDVDLTVLAIDVQPVGDAVDARDPASFSVTMLAGSGVPGPVGSEYTYLWYHQGSPAAGVNNQATYSIASAQGGSPSGSPAPVNPTGSAGEYMCRVTDTMGASIDTEPIQLTVDSVPITFTASPEGGQKYAGENVSMSVAVTGGYGAPYTYQWCRNGTPISVLDVPTAQSQTLIMTGITTARDGLYKCQVGEQGIRPPLPLIDSVEVDLDVRDRIAISLAPWGDHRAAGLDQNHRFRMQITGGYSPYHFAWYRADVGEPDPINNGTLIHEESTVFGDSIYDIIGLAGVHQGSYACHVTDDYLDDETSVAVDLTVLEVGVPPSSLSVNVRDAAPFTITMTPGSGVPPYDFFWYYGNEYIDGSYTTSSSGSSYAVPSAQGGSPDGSVLPVNPTGTAGQYKCLVRDSSGIAEMFSASATLVVNSDPITFAQNPTGGVVYENGSYTFLCVPIGGYGPAYTYQWAFGGTEPANYLEGKTGSTLPLTGLSAAQAGTYYCLVGEQGIRPDSLPYVPSAGASLAVVAGVTFDQEPQNAKVYVNEDYSVSATASGGVGALTCQWYKVDESKADIELPDGDDWTYEKPGIQEGDAGLYYCVVTDDMGTPSVPSDDIETPSPQAELEVARHLVVMDLENVTVPAGSDYTFWVTYSFGFEPIEFVWKKNSAPLGAPNLPSLFLDDVNKDEDEGFYSVLVKDANTDQYETFSVRLTVEETGMPVAGLAALGLLAGALAVGGAARVRRSTRRD